MLSQRCLAQADASWWAAGNSFLTERNWKCIVYSMKSSRSRPYHTQCHRCDVHTPRFHAPRRHDCIFVVAPILQTSSCLKGWVFSTPWWLQHRLCCAPRLGQRPQGKTSLIKSLEHLEHGNMKCTYLPTCMHACIHAYMHTCIHTYTHRYIYKVSVFFALGWKLVAALWPASRCFIVNFNLSKVIRQFDAFRGQVMIGWWRCERYGTTNQRWVSQALMTSSETFSDFFGRRLRR